MIAFATLISVVSVRSGQAAPYAAVVIDARSGEVLYDQNADARLHPASLTKMLTLYIAFDAVRRGEISLDTKITVSKNAASKPPSKLGLRAGQRIALRYLIRAAAVKSANDAASAIGDHLGGSEAGFAARMDRTAKALGMRNSTFKNANGLTASGHLSTARDMTLLGRRLFYDFPEYYNIFSRLQTDAGMTTVRNTNRRFLNDYKGADGIKTGYTSAAGFNLTASAERGNKRIIATIFGGKSTADRNAKMAKLLDLGFGNAKNNVALRKPAAADLSAAVAATQGNGDGRSAGKTIRLVTVLKTSPRPRSRPVSEERVVATAEAVLAMQDDIAGLLAEVAAPLPPSVPPAAIEAAIALARPEPRPETSDAPSEDIEVALDPAPAPTAITETSMALVTPEADIDSSPRRRPAKLLVASAEPAKAAPQAPPVVVTRVSTSGGRHWGVNLGRFPSRSSAERVLMKTALSESVALRDGLRKVIERRGGYDANFMGLSRDQADLACRRLQARAVQCFTIGP
nr:D-alanyl-D-alanine carboxypeptidase family protein [Pseudorhodobacter aquimaris]